MANYFEALSDYINPQDPVMLQQQKLLAMNEPLTPNQALLLNNVVANPNAQVPTQPVPMPAEPPAPSPLDGMKMQVPSAMGTPGSMSAYERDIRDRLDKSVNKSIQQQQAGISGLEKTLASERDKKPDIDFSALAAYFDSNVAGSKLSEGYKAPETPEARQARLAKLEEAIQKSRDGVSDKEVDYMKAMLSNIREGKQDARQQRFDAAQDRAMFNQARKEQSGLIKEATDFRTSYRNVEDAITPNAQGKISAARLHQSLSSFARLMGEKGVLTDTDIGRQLAPSIELWVSKYQNLLASNQDATVDARDVAAIRQALGTMTKAFGENYKLKADAFTEGYFKNPGSPYQGRPWAPKIVEDTYKPLDSMKMAQTPSTPKPPMSFEEFRAAKKAGKL